MASGRGRRPAVAVRAAGPDQPVPEQQAVGRPRGDRLGRAGIVGGVDVAEGVAASRTVWQLLGELAERQRAAVVLRYFHDQSDEEIAQGIGCRRGTARSLISRGLAAMRASLDDRTADRLDLGAQR